MAKVTSKLQVTVPKALADRYKIKPGDDVLWVAAGDAIRMVPVRSSAVPLTAAARLRLFDASSSRQEQRERALKRAKPVKERGWTREDLYDRGRAR